MVGAPNPSVQTSGTVLAAQIDAINKATVEEIAGLARDFHDKLGKIHHEAEKRPALKEVIAVETAKVVSGFERARKVFEKTGEAIDQLTEYLRMDETKPSAT